MNESLLRRREIEARTWTIADERNAARILLAFRRFREETNSDAAAALLTTAWQQMHDGTNEFDGRPYRAK